MAIRPVLFLAFLFAACHSAPAPRQQSADRSQEVRDLIGLMAQIVQQHTAEAEMMSQLQLQLQMPAPMAETAGSIEMTARLGTLTERIEELIACLPRPSSERVSATVPAPAPVEAAGISVAEELAANSAENECIHALQQAVFVVEQQRRLILENIANVNTVGYKKRTQEAVTELDPASGLQLPRAGCPEVVCTTGPLAITERSLDVAIDGDGWFVLGGEDGSRLYTRAGDFRVDAAGRITAGPGVPLMPEITIPNDTLEISFDPTGCVSGRTASDPDTVKAFGRVEIARFLDTGGLESVSGNLMRLEPGTPEPNIGQPGADGFGVLKQGFLERANVQILDEAVDLQVADRQLNMLRRALAGYGVYTR
ncbi:MAG: flagellar hook-basal body complex protein [Planctomycetes bacterium]|nr:flagellar hook-basal body complex protein [Planctomycetota bacterium]